MRRKKKSENNGFNVWRSYSDMMAFCADHVCDPFSSPKKLQREYPGER